LLTHHPITKDNAICKDVSIQILMKKHDKDEIYNYVEFLK